jgi:integrase
MPLLTDKFVRNVRIPDPGPGGAIAQKDIWDEAIPGFGLRVSSTGKKSWMVGVRLLKAGKMVFTRISLGSYPAISLSQARDAARDAKLLASQNKDPRELKAQQKALMLEQSRNTFSAVVDEFLKKYVERKGLRASTTRDYVNTLKGRDVADWNDRPVSAITKKDVLRVVDQIIERGAPIEANHFLARTKKFFGWCAERDLVEFVPTDRIKPPCKVNHRDRALSPDEVREVWQAIEEMEANEKEKQRGDIFGPMFRMLLLTGQRREEVAGMRWDEIRDLDGDRPQWELPESRTKNRRPHIVPLVPQAVKIIRALPRIGDSPFVFTTTGRSHVSGFSKAKTTLDHTIALRRARAGVRESMPGFVVHDLRRTVSTRMNEELGILPHVVEAVLNHVSGLRAGVAGTYNRALYLDEKRKALAAWADYIDRLVKPKTAPNG